MRLDALLQTLAVRAFSDCFGTDLEAGQFSVQKTRSEFPGDRTIVCFPLARFSKVAPDATADALGQALVGMDGPVTGHNVVKGFLNLELDPTYWLSWLLEDAAAADYGIEAPESAPHVMVEYSSPNTNKPLHLGHLRNNFLGHSVSRILENRGHTVTKVQIINDRGIHICKSMVAWQRFGHGETPETSGLKGDKLVGKYYVAFDQAYKEEVAELVEGGMAKEEAEKAAPILIEAQETLRRWEDGEADTVALWKTMNGWVYAGFDITYATMGVEFDTLYYESDTYLIGRDRVLEGVERGLFQQREDGFARIRRVEGAGARGGGRRVRKYLQCGHERLLLGGCLAEHGGRPCQRICRQSVTGNVRPASRTETCITPPRAPRSGRTTPRPLRGYRKMDARLRASDLTG